MYVSAAEKKEIIQTMGDSAYALYEYYVDNSYRENFEFTDEKAAESIGWTKYKAKRIRIKLNKNNWFYQERYKSGSGNKVTIFYIGKEKVLEVMEKKELSVFQEMAIAKKVMDELGLKDEADLKGNKEAIALYKQLADVESSRR